MGILNRIFSLFQGLNWLIIPAAFFAIVFHEVSHGYVAYLLGDRTAKERGRLTLNPMRHMDPVGLICMILFGFGWAKPVPVNPYYFKNKKLGMSLVSLAGPLSNLLMTVISVFLMLAVAKIEVQSELALRIILVFEQFFLYLSVLNVGLAVFNLLPIPPLDGSKILFSLLPANAYGFILKYEQYGMLILIILINMPFFSEILMSIRQFVYDGILGTMLPIFF